jgi:eukaryotic-like serine/threonine-protein kinase
MGLVPNSRLGAYEIVALIGSGGMGEVYQARDTRLDRLVALKVIASAGAVDPELRTRFEREARAISSLNHPHICVLHDIGRERPLPPASAGMSAAGPSSAESVPLDFLVMEHLEGETLAARLARGTGRSTTSPRPPMTVDEALAVAIQIASALDGAHRAGIVHRDLKPGNIMLTKGERVGSPAGTPASSAQVKLMDFGLARLTGADTEKKGHHGHGMVSLAELSLPTVSSPLTKQGTILGTLQYMSPEQLRGEGVDARTDIFAFGVVLYEMLSGRRPFEAKSQAGMIGAILEHDPAPVTSLQPLTPPLLAELVARCLAKDPDGRWQSARDLMRQLEWIAAGSGAAAPTVTQSPEEPSRMRGRVLRTSAALLATALIAGGIVAWMLRPIPVPTPVVSRFSFDLPEGQQFTRGGRRVVAVSPDGTRLVYVANQQLYLRNMRELTPDPISGTEGSDPADPVVSPDGQSVAFWSDGALKKIPVTGGTPVRLSAAENPLGASWEDGRILLGQLTPRGIVEIPENGGAAKLVVTLDEKAGEQARSPQLVAGGRSVLFTLRTGEAEWDDASIVVQDLATGHRKVLLQGGTDARVLPTGHLVYVNASTIFAVPLDETTLAVTGGSVPVQQIEKLSYAVSQAVWSASGTLVLAHGVQGYYSALVWVDRHDKQERTALPLRNYGVGSSEIRLSPDGTRVAATIFSDEVLNLTGTATSTGTAASEVWAGDMTRGALTRLSKTGQATSPVWTPDGQRVCYDSGGEAFCQPADGRAATAEALFKVEGLINTRPFARDGRRMVLETRGPKTGNDITIATMGPPVETRPLLNTVHAESAPAISPDGRWLAYQSDESGRAEVCVRPFPAVDQGLWPISTGGGSEPRWAPNGRELFFTVRSGGWSTPGVLMSVPVQTGSTFIAGKPTPVLKIPAGASAAYDVAPDGRFLFHFQGLRPAGEEAPRPGIVVVQNWFEELKARVQTGTAK